MELDTCVCVPRLLLSLIAIALLGAGVAARAQDPTARPAMPAFKSSATQVAVTAAVRHANGTPVTTLTKNDFEILDNGERRTISSFWFEPSAASVALLFDRSGSMRLGNKLDIGRDAVGQLLSWLDAGTDQVSLMGFDHDVSRLSPFVSAPGRVLADLAHVDAFGTTALLDAMTVGAREVTALRTRRAVVVVTDGLDTDSRWTAADVARFAAGIDVPVYVLVATLAVDRDRAIADAATLADLARRTGGESFIVTTPADASVATRTIASDLHHQYLMAFSSDGTPGWHALDVRVKQQQLLVRARTGYDAGLRTDRD
jgi:Ca-activated chloride channel family protein